VNRRPVFIAAYLAVSVLVIWVICSMTDREMWVGDPIDISPTESSGPRWQGTPSLSGGDSPSATSLVPDLQMSRGEELVDGIVSGRIHHSELQEFFAFPGYDGCQKCLEECDQGAPEGDQGASQPEQEECRRKCLSNCSSAAKRLMQR